MHMSEGRSRVIIERVTPSIDNGKFAIKRVPDEVITVEADVFVDGHDLISCNVLYRRRDETAWSREPMAFLVNDRWQADISFASVGPWVFSIEAWVDRFKTWSHALQKRVDADQDVSVDRLIGAELIADAVKNADGHDADRLREFA